MAPINVLVMIHGMTPNLEPSSPFGEYEAFWRRLVRRRPDLPGLLRQRIGVQWGHALPKLAGAELATAREWSYQQSQSRRPRPDEYLTRAQINIGKRVNYDNVRKDSSANNILIGDNTGINPLYLFLRPIVQNLREQIIVTGFGDALYYCSQEGEQSIRRVVYEQILARLNELTQSTSTDEVRLHIVAQSLGVTVAHDFLYGLFAPDHRPDFLNQASDRSARQTFKTWRDHAQRGYLRLGSFVATASQLPVLLMRKQKLVEMLAANNDLDPRVIGIDPADHRRRWIIFHDRDDLLGFATRRLYKPCEAIVDMQVDVADRPDRAHTDYWQNDAVSAASADLIAGNCR